MPAIAAIEVRVPVQYQTFYITPGQKYAIECIVHGNQPGGGNRVKAIKYIRMELGCGLKEAKDVVDTICPPAHVYTQPETMAEVFRRNAGL